MPAVSDNVLYQIDHISMMLTDCDSATITSCPFPSSFFLQNMNNTPFLFGLATVGANNWWLLTRYWHLMVSATAKSSVIEISTVYAYWLIKLIDRMIKFVAQIEWTAWKILKYIMVMSQALTKGMPFVALSSKNLEGLKKLPYSSDHFLRLL